MLSIYVIEEAKKKQQWLIQWEKKFHGKHLKSKYTVDFLPINYEVALVMYSH